MKEEEVAGEINAKREGERWGGGGDSMEERAVGEKREGGRGGRGV